MHLYIIIRHYRNNARIDANRTGRGSTVRMSLGYRSLSSERVFSRTRKRYTQNISKEKKTLFEKEKTTFFAKINFVCAKKGLLFGALCLKKDGAGNPF